MNEGNMTGFILYTGLPTKDETKLKTLKLLRSQG